jgi:uncharacterized phage-associated protein
MFRSDTLFRAKILHKITKKIYIFATFMRLCMAGINKFVLHFIRESKRGIRNANRTTGAETPSGRDRCGCNDRQDRDRRNYGNEESQIQQDKKRSCRIEGPCAQTDTRSKDGDRQEGGFRSVGVMAAVRDVAQFVLDAKGEMTAMKLQKLVYYSQAWHIAWTDNVLFPERIEAWKDGPVCPELFKLHAKSFRVSKMRGAEASRLTADERDTIQRVLSHYGDKSPQWLSDLTHLEAPWLEARRGVPAGVASNAEISPQSMGNYYASL